MSPYRVSAKPEELAPKKPFLCRIGFHVWGGWVLDGCSVFWCTRCEKHFFTNKHPEEVAAGDTVVSWRQVLGEVHLCENKWATEPCRNNATCLVQLYSGAGWVLCDKCTMHMIWGEDVETVIARPLLLRTP